MIKRLHIPFVLLLVFSVGGVMDSRRAFADEYTYWSAGSGQIWNSGFGECWTGATGRTDPSCGDDHMMEEEPTPVMAAAPNLDVDGDGVPNSEDICSTTPVGNTVDVYGCTIKIEHSPVLSLRGVHFASDSSVLTSEARSMLDSALRKIRYSSGLQIDVVGHTDSRLSDSYNQALSERRARAVVDYLISRGIPASSLNARGMGERSPVASNDTREGRARNRRVEISFR